MPARCTVPSSFCDTPGPATGLPLVVMAGHSACLSPDGPVHSRVPTGVFTGLLVQPKLLP